MDGPACVIRVHYSGAAVMLRLEGRATINQSTALRRMSEQCQTRRVSRLLLDLCRCTYMDSTFLGTLLHLKRSAARSGLEIALVAPSAECCQLLQQMGLADVLPVIDVEEPAEHKWLLLPEEPEDPSALKSNIVWAHQELGKLTSPTAEHFRAVAACLASDLESEKS